MSYYANIYFKKVENMEQGVKILNDFIEDFVSLGNLKNVIDDCKYWFYRQLKNSKIKLEEDDIYEYMDFYRNMFQSTLIFKAMYFPKYNLLGLCTSSQLAKKHFDGYIYFQDSSDQNYDFEEWDVLGDYFINKANEFKKMSFEKILEINDHLNSNEYEKEYILKKIDYFRKCSMYDFVWKTLDLDNWLYTKRSEKGIFIPLNLCVPLVNDNENLFLKIRKIFNEQYQKDKKKE